MIFGCVFRCSSFLLTTHSVETLEMLYILQYDENHFCMSVAYTQQLFLSKSSSHKVTWLHTQIFNIENEAEKFSNMLSLFDWKVLELLSFVRVRVCVWVVCKTCILGKTSIENCGAAFKYKHTKQTVTITKLTRNYLLQNLWCTISKC